MSALAIEHTYRYAEPSFVAPDGRITLVSSAGVERQPFFLGTLAHPDRTAALLLVLTQVVRTRFHIPPAMREHLILLADPVITCGAERLRVEGFSACCGVYARLDLLSDAFSADRAESGTTNVDFNPPMRAALARVQARERVRLSVSTGQVEVETTRGSAVERKVKLPMRWLKGFGEVQARQAEMEPRFTLNPGMAHRLLAEIPRRPSRGPVWVAPMGGAVRISQQPISCGVAVGGIERLRILEGIVRHATSLQVYASAAGVTAWQVVTPEARFHLVLSPEPWRGFSGEGQVLSRFVDQPATPVLGRVRAALRWQAVLDSDSLARELALDLASVNFSLARLGAAGVAGYDLAEHAYFHRELPYDLSLVERLQPRLEAARTLAGAGGVRFEGDEAWVRGTGVEHRVRETAEGWRCSCPWFARHGGSRGPCKHVLAVRTVRGGEDDAE